MHTVHLLLQNCMRIINCRLRRLFRIAIDSVWNTYLKYFCISNWGRDLDILANLHSARLRCSEFSFTQRNSPKTLTLSTLDATGHRSVGGARCDWNTVSTIGCAFAFAKSSEQPAWVYIFPIKFKIEICGIDALLLSEDIWSEDAYSVLSTRITC